MRSFEAHITYAAPVEAVAVMMADPEFVERKVAASRPVSSAVDVSGDASGAFTVTTERALPTDELPAAVQNLVGRAIQLRLVEAWAAPQSDGSRTGTVRLDVVGKPAGASGTTRLAPSADGGSIVEYTGSVEARIPLLGRRVEEQAVQQVHAVLDAEKSVGVAWLAQR